MPQLVTMGLTKKNYNAAVNDYGIDLKKIAMPQSLMCMSMWLERTSLSIILIFDLFS